MKQNQFIVDLGDLKLSEDQRVKINAAIQKAVTGELAVIGTANKLALFPFGGKGGKFPGPIIWGIIARPRQEHWVKDLNIGK